MSEPLIAKPHITRRGGQIVVEYRVSNASAARMLMPAQAKELNAIWSNQSSAWSTLIDWQPGAWQRNLANPHSTQSVLAFSAVYRCISLISGDISKLRPMLMAGQQDGTRIEVGEDSPFLPVLRKPNSYQTWIQFADEWQKSRLVYGNAYVLKERDNRGGAGAGIVRALYVLDPCGVTLLVSDSGEVFYRLRKDYLAQIEEDDMIVPASEIIHDRMITFWHPLIGVSPIYACGMSAMQGTAIQNNASEFFKNMSRPGGILTAPGKISNETAERIKKDWNERFSGTNVGKLAVAGDGLKYEPLTMPATDAQLIEQLEWTVGDVARAFGVPPYKLGLQTNVTFSNAGQLNQDYYSQCLQTPIFAMQALLREGLELPSNYRVWLNLDDLLIMDPLGQAETNGKMVQAGMLKPNEGRLKANLPPVEGGDTPYLQQQNFSLAALAKRDAQADPFAKATAQISGSDVAPAAPAPAAPPPAAKELADELMARIEAARGAAERGAAERQEIRRLSDYLARRFHEAAA